MFREEKILKKIKSITLENGLKVIYTPNTVHPVISMQLFVRMGSCWENENEAGYSHFTEHLVFKSTDKFPNNELTIKASFLGSNINAYTEFDSTCYYLTLSSKFCREGLEILSELARFANFSDKEFRAEKGVILEEINQYLNDPEDSFVEDIPRLYFAESPFKKPIIGTKKSIHNSTPDELRAFYKKHYTPQNCYLVVTGDFIEETLLKEVNELFGDWSRGDTIPLPSYETIYPKALSIDSIKKKISKPILAFALPELSDRDPKSHTLGIITRIFAVGKKSRLHKRLFIKEKLVEQVKVESYTGINDGISVIIVMPLEGAYVEKIIDIFIEEFDRIRHLGFSIDEFKEAKTELIHSHRYSMEYAQYLGMSLGTDELLDDYRNYLIYPETVNSITEASVQEMANKHYSFDKLGIYHLGGEFRLKEKISEKISVLQKKRIKNGAIRADFFETPLKNGANILLKRVTGRPTIGITASFPVSQLNERDNTRGLNLLTSTLILYGNEKYSYSQLMEYCSKHGILISASANEETTTIKIKCFPEMLTTSLDLLADILLSPTFPIEHFHSIQRSLISNFERL